MVGEKHPPGCGAALLLLCLTIATPNGGEFAGSLIQFVAECMRCGGGAMRDEALQRMCYPHLGDIGSESFDSWGTVGIVD